MSHLQQLDHFFSDEYVNLLPSPLFGNPESLLPLADIKEEMIQLTKISLVEFFNYLDNRPHIHEINHEGPVDCGALVACTDELCAVMREKGADGMTTLEIGKSPVFQKYLRTPNRATWMRFGGTQAKTAHVLGLTFRHLRQWYLTGYGYAYAFRYLNNRQQQQFLCRSLLRNPFYARILMEVREQEISLKSYLSEYSPSTQARRAASVMKLLRLGLDEMDREGIKWHDIHVPRYRAKTKQLVEYTVEGSYTALDTYPMSDDFFAGAIPLYTVKAACGYFDTNEIPEQEGWLDLSGLGMKTDSHDYFVVHAKGDSMLPKIKDGDLCLFKWYRGEMLNDQIVLTQCRDYDEEYESSYTIKRFHQPTPAPGEPRTIALEPLNKKNYTSILLSEDDGCDYKTVGVFVKVLN